jgi:hypothetical protein
MEERRFLQTLVPFDVVGIFACRIRVPVAANQSHTCNFWDMKASFLISRPRGQIHLSGCVTSSLFFSARLAQQPFASSTINQGGRASDGELQEQNYLYDFSVDRDSGGCEAEIKIQ